MAIKRVVVEEMIRKLSLQESSSSRDICKSCLFMDDSSWRSLLKGESPPRANFKEDSSSIASCKNSAVQEVAKGIDCTICGVAEGESSSSLDRCKICVAKMEASLASRAACNVCGPSMERCRICVAMMREAASAFYAGCKICLAKEGAMNRIKATGGDCSKATVEKELKARPLAKVTTANLNKMQSEGGYVIKTAAKKGTTEPVVTVRLPESCTTGLMSVSPRTPLRALSDDFFEKYPDPKLRQNIRECAVAALWGIVRQENVFAQAFKEGYATMELEVDDGYY